MNATVAIYVNRKSENLRGSMACGDTVSIVGNRCGRWLRRRGRGGRGKRKRHEAVRADPVLSTRGGSRTDRPLFIDINRGSS